jgi:hypothetical protein
MLLASIFSTSPRHTSLRLTWWLSWKLDRLPCISGTFFSIFVDRKIRMRAIVLDPSWWMIPLRCQVSPPRCQFPRDLKLGENWNRPEIIFDATEQAGVRALVSAGWVRAYYIRQSFLTHIHIRVDWEAPPCRLTFSCSAISHTTGSSTTSASPRLCTTAAQAPRR